MGKFHVKRDSHENYLNRRVKKAKTWQFACVVNHKKGDCYPDSIISPILYL